MSECNETMKTYLLNSTIFAFHLIRYYAEFKEANAANLIELLDLMDPVIKLVNGIEIEIKIVS